MDAGEIRIFEEIAERVESGIDDLGDRRVLVNLVRRLRAEKAELVKAGQSTATEINHFLSEWDLSCRLCNGWGQHEEDCPAMTFLDDRVW